MEAGSTWHTWSAVVKEMCPVSKRSGDLWPICFLSAGYFIYDFFDMLLNQKLSQSWELLFHHVVVSPIFASDPGWEAASLTGNAPVEDAGTGRTSQSGPRNKESVRAEERETILPVCLLTPSHAPPPSHPPTELDESHQSQSSSAYWPAAGEPAAKNVVKGEYASSTKPPQPLLLL